MLSSRFKYGKMVILRFAVTVTIDTSIQGDGENVSVSNGQTYGMSLETSFHLMTNVFSLLSNPKTSFCPSHARRRMIDAG
jgi:hypothetical protein